MERDEDEKDGELRMFLFFLLWLLLCLVLRSVVRLYISVLHYHPAPGTALKRRRQYTYKVHSSSCAWSNPPPCWSRLDHTSK